MKADKTRQEQILESKKVKSQEKQKIKKSLKKIEDKEKISKENIGKTALKKKPLTTKKK